MCLCLCCTTLWALCALPLRQKCWSKKSEENNRRQLSECLVSTGRDLTSYCCHRLFFVSFSPIVPGHPFSFFDQKHSGVTHLVSFAILLSLLILSVSPCQLKVWALSATSNLDVFVVFFAVFDVDFVVSPNRLGVAATAAAAVGADANLLTTNMATAKNAVFTFHFYLSPFFSPPPPAAAVIAYLK